MISTREFRVGTSNAYNLADTKSFEMQKKQIDSSQRGLSNNTKRTTNRVILRKLSRDEGC